MMSILDKEKLTGKQQENKLEVIQRGMVAPELLFLKISGKFGILPEMIV